MANWDSRGENLRAGHQQKAIKKIDKGQSIKQKTLPCKGTEAETADTAKIQPYVRFVLFQKAFDMVDRTMIGES